MRLGGAIALVASICLLGLVGAALYRAHAPAPIASVGQAAPDIVIHDFDGQTVRLSALRGEPVVIDFWASWCLACRQEAQLLRTAAGAHQGQVQFVGVDFNDDESSARSYLQSDPAGFPIGPAVTGGSRDYGVSAPPAAFFVDAHGRLAASFTGQLDGDSLNHYLAMVTT